MSVQVFEVIERSVLALGYELVDVELAAGTLRVFIDWPAEKQARVTIEDCELVSRQLSQVMMVEAIDSVVGVNGRASLPEAAETRARTGFCCLARPRPRASRLNGCV